MPRRQEPRGCLFALWSGLEFLLWGGRDGSTALPYRVSERFLSPAELTFYRVLSTALPPELIACPKVNLGDLFFVVGRSRAYRNKIDRKHVDFLLCGRDSMLPYCGVELDDRSHQRADRIERDQFVDAVFAAAELPLLRFPVRSSYSPHDIRRAIQSLESPVAESTSEPPPLPTERNDVPICPRCRVPMVSRTATRGARAGQSFWGCRHYPDCRYIVQ